jgi:hypothetical protein
MLSKQDMFHKREGGALCRISENAVEGAELESIDKSLCLQATEEPTMDAAKLFAPQLRGLSQLRRILKAHYGEEVAKQAKEILFSTLTEQEVTQLVLKTKFLTNKKTSTTEIQENLQPYIARNPKYIYRETSLINERTRKTQESIQLLEQERERLEKKLAALLATKNQCTQ